MSFKEGDTQPTPIATNLLSQGADAKEAEISYLNVFNDGRQTGILISGRESVSLTARIDSDENVQQTLHVISGEGWMRLEDTEYQVRKGHVAVVPAEVPVSFPEIEKDFLAFSLISKDPTARAQNRSSSFIVTNLFDLHASEEAKPFMSTSDANGEQHASSKVKEIPVFSPDMAKEGYALNGSQAARLLIYDEEITLDRHTHPLAQHAIYVLAGHGSVEFEGQKYDLTPGGLFVVPPNTKHQLGSYGNFLAFVVNTPGIPSTHEHYSKPA